MLTKLNKAHPASSRQPSLWNPKPRKTNDPIPERQPAWLSHSVLYFSTSHWLNCSPASCYYLMKCYLYKTFVYYFRGYSCWTPDSPWVHIWHAQSRANSTFLFNYINPYYSCMELFPPPPLPQTAGMCRGEHLSPRKARKYSTDQANKKTAKCETVNISTEQQERCVYTNSSLSPAMANESFHASHSNTQNLTRGCALQGSWRIHLHSHEVCPALLICFV